MRWEEALTIGSILAATDPVAVVALLKEMETPLSFNVLLEGESHIVDGIATVFFWVFYEWVEKGSFSGVKFAEEFLRLSVGGAFFGLFMAIIFY